MFACLVFPSVLTLAGFAGDATCQDPPAPAADFAVRAADGGVTEANLAAVRRLIPQALARIAPSFPGTPSAPFSVVLHSDESSLAEDDARHLHHGTPGFALLGRNQIHVLLDHLRGTPPDDLRTVLAHELTHVLIDQFAGPVANRVPRWLHEGLAQCLSGDTYLQAKEVDIVMPARFGRLESLSHLSADFPKDDYARRLAYHQSFSFVDWLIRRRGMAVIRRGIQLATETDGFAAGYALATDRPLIEEYDRWLHWLQNDSGASWTFLFENCFSYSMILGFVLLALAGIRIGGREARMRAKLERDETVQAQAMLSEDDPSTSLPADDTPQDDTGETTP